MKTKKVKILDSSSNSQPCILCNPKKYLKFSFAFITFESKKYNEKDIIKLWERMKWLSERPYLQMVYDYKSDKSLWFEKIPLSEIKNEIPAKFRELFPTETNERYDVMRVYPSGVPNGTANPRIIGMIKHSVFYIFYLDWEGKLYKHSK